MHVDKMLEMAYDMLLLWQTKWRATGHLGKYFGQRSFRMPLCISRHIAEEHSAKFSGPPPESLHLPMRTCRETRGVPLDPFFIPTDSIRTILIRTTLTPERVALAHRFRLAAITSLSRRPSIVTRRRAPAPSA